MEQETAVKLQFDSFRE